jgi:hypothetical protein
MSEPTHSRSRSRTAAGSTPPTKQSVTVRKAPFPIALVLRTSPPPFSFSYSATDRLLTDGSLDCCDLDHPLRVRTGPHPRNGALAGTDAFRDQVSLMLAASGALRLTLACNRYGLYRRYVMFCWSQGERLTSSQMHTEDTREIQILVRRCDRHTSNQFLFLP